MITTLFFQLNYPFKKAEWQCHWVYDRDKRAKNKNKSVKRLLLFPSTQSSHSKAFLVHDGGNFTHSVRVISACNMPHYDTNNVLFHWLHPMLHMQKSTLGTGQIAASQFAHTLRKEPRIDTEDWRIYRIYSKLAVSVICKLPIYEYAKTVDHMR